MDILFDFHSLHGNWYDLYKLYSHCTYFTNLTIGVWHYEYNYF